MPNSLPSLTPQTSLSGVIVFGQEPVLMRCRKPATWPTLIRAGSLQIAIDGHFVIADRLHLGRTEEECKAVGELIRADLREFLTNVQNGFFNIIVNDYERRETRICNDRFGGLPLYIVREPDRITFASTYAGLREQGLTDLRPDPVGTAQLYWFGYQLGNRTALTNVQLLPPGSEWTIGWEDGRVQVREAIAPVRRQESFRTIGELAEHVVSTMRSVAKRLHRDDVGVGVKVSGGMDSRLICGTWPDNAVRAYTYGYPGCAEVQIARRLAQSLGMRHTFIPIEGDFFTRLHAPLFGLHGITEFFHQAALPAMLHDGVVLVLDGLAGDVVLGGLTLKPAVARWRQALGLAPGVQEVPVSEAAMAEYIFRHIRVADEHYRPLVPEAQRELASTRNDILHDIALEVRQARFSFTSFAQIYTDVILRNRTRRYISLQGTLCRPQVEAVYPFMDRDFLALRGAIPAQWAANKRLYIEVYSRHLPAIRSVPSLFSLLPFTAPQALHYPGRVVRYGAEQVGLKISYGTRNRARPWAANGVQWARWLAFNDAFRDGARAFMRASTVFDERAFERDTRDLARGPKLSATRFMLTASYCGHFRNARAVDFCMPPLRAVS